ncbi:hypothetical protein KI387_020119, partial [Taxus chinensis]
TADEWRDLIRRVCTDTLMIPIERTRAKLSVDDGEPSSTGRHTNVFALVWHMARMVSTLHTELVGYRTVEHLMRNHSRGETTATPRDPEPSMHSECRRSQSPRHGHAPLEGSHR